MLTTKDLDTLMDSISKGQDTYIYYVAHMIEGRETSVLDEHTYKNVSRFRVMKLKVLSVRNAYFELLNYINNPKNYHEESVEYWYDKFTKYIHYFITKNYDKSYTKPINAREPSIVYGYRRKTIDDNGSGEKVIKTITDPSPVKVVYTNALEYLDLPNTEATNLMNTTNKLNWKYMKLKTPESVDGIDYYYITSNFYILDLDDYPMTEKPLIEADKHSDYFMSVDEAYEFIEQLLA